MTSPHRTAELLRRRDPLVEYVVHAPVVERVLWLQLVSTHGPTVARRPGVQTLRVTGRCR